MPHMDVRRLISDELHGKPKKDLDKRICAMLQHKPVGAVTTNLKLALDLIPKGWWWHISHLEVKITPTGPSEFAQVSNAVDYDENGYPLSYRAMYFGNRDDIPRCICEAMLKARYDLPCAFVVVASAKRQAKIRRDTHLS